MCTRLVYGLDLGINNVGWAVVHKGDQEVDVVACGTFVFASPLEDENDAGEGLKSKVRGHKRRARRTGRRRHQRKMGLYRLLAEHGLLPAKMADRVALLCAQSEPYSLRAKGLEERLEPCEFGRILCHLNQRRGFLSPRDLMLFGIDRFDDEEPASEEEEAPSKKDKDEDTGRIRAEVRSTREAMEGFETVGAFLFDRLRQGLPVRKKKVGAPSSKEQKAEDERRFVRADRHMVKQEFDLLWERQAQHHPILTDALKAQVERLVFFQRNLSADPTTRGRCRFEPGELTMPRASLTAQRFVLAQDLAHLLVTEDPSALRPDGGLFDEEGETANWEALTTPRPLTAHERKILLDALMQGRDLPWNEVKTMIGLTERAVFNIEPTSYQIVVNGKNKTIKQTSGTKRELRGSQTVARLRGILGEKWPALGEQAQRELVGEIVSIRDWVGQMHEEPAAFRRRKLFTNKKYGPGQIALTEREANELATVALPEGYLNLSLKAAKKILPGILRERNYEVSKTDSSGKVVRTTLRGPLVYADACWAAGYDHTNVDGDLPTLDRLPFPNDKDIPHAIVRTSVRSAVRILNALHREHGRPDAIHIELPRDLAMGAQQREEAERRIKKSESAKEEIRKELVAIGVRPSGGPFGNIRKVQLWKELGGAALAMEPDITVSDIKDLFNGGYDIGHIVPRGHNLDNSMANLFLCTEHFNRQIQGDRTPYEALGQTDAWPRIVAHVKSLRPMPLHKRQRLLAKERPEDFTGRHLAATGWISREVLKLAQRMVEHKPDALVVPGRATGDFRKFWGLEDLVPRHPVEQEVLDEWKKFLDKAEKGKATEKDVKEAKAPNSKERSNFLHHAVDALVVALTDRATLQAMAAYEQLRARNDPRWVDKEQRKRAKAEAVPDPNLRHKAEAALLRAEVVHRPTRRPRGELHKQLAQKDGLEGVPPGKPWSREVVGNHLVVFDSEGRPAQSYPLGNNHHVVIWERTAPNAKGVNERAAEVVPMIEAVRRRDAAAAARKWNKENPGKPPRTVESVIRKSRPEPGWRFVMALCKGDTVEMSDGRIGVVSKFYAPQEGRATIAVWRPYAAQQLGKINAENPYLVKNMSSLHDVSARIVLDPLGQVVYREGGEE